MKLKQLDKCQRRINIEKISSITHLKGSEEFAIHIPMEYDYRYKVPLNDKAMIIQYLGDVYGKKTG